MAAHADHSHASAEPEKLQFPVDKARGLFNVARITGVAGLGLSLGIAVISTQGLRRFYFSYLTAFAFILSIVLSSLVFLLIQHVVRAGWSVVVRRLMENIACTVPFMGLMSIPILLSVVMHRGDLYRWALPMSAAEPAGEHAGPAKEEVAGPGEQPVHPQADKFPAGAAKADGEKTEAVKVEGAEAEPEKLTLDELTLKKRAWLNPWFFCLRVIVYFAVWSGIALWYRRQSILQDQSGDVQYTHNMQKRAPVALILCALTVTLAAFDLVMSLDPHWYSTIFGVYYFAGGTIAFWATLIILTFTLQRAGYLKNSINKEHYHDLGKFLFGFVFFWGYIAFSQYMLLWYSNIPEETEYLSRHGFTTAVANMTGWTYVGIFLLIFKLAIPFLGLLSRHVKRNPPFLLFWAVWLLIAHYVDVYWMVMPEMRIGFRPNLIDLTTLACVGGAAVAAFLRVATTASLRPSADPRLPEALAFHNI